MLSEKELRALLSAATHKQIERQLLLWDKTTTIREKNAGIIPIKDLLIKLLTYKNIYDLHNDHLIELLETFAELYPESERLSEYALEIRGYLDAQIKKIEINLTQAIHTAERARRTKGTPPLMQLDLDYQVWVYQHGYYRSRKAAYQLILQVLKELIAYKETIKCKQKRKQASSVC